MNSSSHGVALGKTTLLYSMIKMQQNSACCRSKIYFHFYIFYGHTFPYSIWWTYGTSRLVCDFYRCSHRRRLMSSVSFHPRLSGTKCFHRDIWLMTIPLGVEGERQQSSTHKKKKKKSHLESASSHRRNLCTNYSILHLFSIITAPAAGLFLLKCCTAIFNITSMISNLYFF